MSYPIRVRAGGFILSNNQLLLAEFHDENGLHYNMPSGGVEAMESVTEGAVREVLEEAGLEVEVGPLAFVYEYAPHLTDNRYGQTPTLSFFFDCKPIQNNLVPIPKQLDPTQLGAKWIPVNELDNILLYPKIQNHIKTYITTKQTLFIRETDLE